MVGPEITTHVDQLEKDILNLISRFQLRCSNWSEAVEVQDLQFTPIKTLGDGMRLGPSVKINISVNPQIRKNQ